MSDTQPKRLLRVVSKLNISGPTLQAVMLTSALRRKGYECLLVGGYGDDAHDNMSRIADAHAVEPIIIDELNYTTPFGFVPALIKLYRLIKETKPDIVHTHNTQAGIVGRIAARLAGIPVVVHTLHEYPFHGYYNRRQTIFFIYMERLGAYFSDSIVTLSQGLRKALSKTYGITRKSRITVLPLGFDLQSFIATKRHTGAFRTAWGIAEDVPLVGIIGRLLPVKNHRLFLETAVRVRQSLPDAHFVIIGDGEERPDLEAYAQELGIASQVIFTGWQQDMEPIYSDLDVLVSSSLNEGTPVPLIEALAAGCPVVATDVGGIADLLDGGKLGALVPSGDAPGLADAIITTLAHPPDMSVAQATMLRRYGIDRLADDLDSLYRGLFTKKRNAVS